MNNAEKDFLKSVQKTMQQYLIYLEDPIDVTNYLQTMFDISARLNQKGDENE